VIGAFDELTCDLDVLIVDNAPGISSSSLRFTSAAHEVIVVVCDEPASITDAYAVIKVLSRDHGVEQFNLLVNKTDNASQAREVFTKINRVAERFLDVTLNPIGEIPRDTYLQRSIQEQAGVVLRYPGSASARAFHTLARKATSRPAPGIPRGHVEFFVERTVSTAIHGDTETPSRLSP
jgi:flagellar biosynthesis protein FlhG